MNLSKISIGALRHWIPAHLWRLPLLILLIAAGWGGGYLRRDLWEPDEARYAYVAAEMRDTGHFWVPHRNGEVYAHKPPLMFWLIQAGSVLTGGQIGGVATRLPSLLGGILILWATARLARLWYGPDTEWRVILLLSTTFIFWRQVGTGQIDALLGGLEMTALYLLFSADAGESRPTLRRAGAWLSLGLAILAKGPVGLLVPCGAYLAACLAAGEFRRCRSLHWVWGLPLALAVPGAWLLAIALTGAPAGYFHQLLFDQTVARAAGELGHLQPFYYFAAYFGVDFLPWIFFFPACLLVLFRSTETRPANRRLLAWMLFVLIFFSLSPSKRNLYVFLAYPAAALLVAAIAPSLARLHRAWVLIPAHLLMSLLALMALALGGAWLVPRLPVPSPLFLPLAAALAAGVFWLFRNRHELLSYPARWLIRMALVFLLLQTYVGAVILPAFNRLKTPHELAPAAQRIIPPNGRLILFRMDGEIQALYAHRRGLRVDTPEALIQAMTEQQHGMVVFQRRQWADLRAFIPGVQSENPYQMGRKHLIWIEFNLRPKNDSSP